jgi:hypothetical protein
VPARLTSTRLGEVVEVVVVVLGVVLDAWLAPAL